MSNQHDLRNEYLRDIQHQYPQHPYQPQDNDSGRSFFGLFFLVFVMVGLMLAAFWFGVLAPMVKKLKTNEKPESKPKMAEIQNDADDFDDDDTDEDEDYLTPIISLNSPEIDDENEDDIDDRFATLNNNLGLLENPFEVGRKLTDSE